MPKYIDVHPMPKMTKENFRALQKHPRDEFGVTHHDILFSAKENRCCCVLDAPNREAVVQHHAKAGITCDFVQEVESSRD